MKKIGKICLYTLLDETLDIVIEWCYNRLQDKAMGFVL